MCRAWEEHIREAIAFLCEPFSSRSNVYLVRVNILDPALLIFHCSRGQIAQYFYPTTVISPSSAMHRIQVK
jgi:hypothetical protein